MSEEQKQTETTQETPEDVSSPSEEATNLENMSSDTPDVDGSTPDNPLEEVIEELKVPQDAPLELEVDQTLTITALQKEIEGFRQQVSDQQQQYDLLKGQHLRLAADFENFRNRVAKEKEELQQKIKSNTIIELLPAIDNFERARLQIKPANDGELTIHKSYQGVYKNLVDGLKRLGVSAMRAEGQEFDPNLHEAMFREPTADHPEDTVIEQLVRGYMLGEQVLRHAMVKVAAAPEPMVTSEGEKSEETSQQDASES